MSADEAGRETELANLLVVFTGGTISCTLDPERGVPVPTMTGTEILERAPEIRDIAHVVADDFGRFPGPHMSPARMLALARRIDGATRDADFDGVVVTHGTDTLEETAFFLDRVLSPDVPVAVLGAMKLASDPGWDGAANLVAAARVASHPASRGRGTQVVMNDTIHAAPLVTKEHTEALDAFASPLAGPVGAVDRGEVIYFVPPPPRHPRLWVEELSGRVDLVGTAAGADGCHVEASLAAGATGLVVAGLGRGNLPPEMADAVADASRRIPVVMASRCPRGRTAPMYGYEGGAATLRRSGVIFADHLSPPKARLLLWLLLACGADRDAIREAFEGDRYARFPAS